MLIFIVVIIITGYFYYNYYSSNYDSSHKSWIIASTAVVILHIIYGVSLQTFFYHYLTYCNYCCNRCKKKKKTVLRWVSRMMIFFYFLQIRRAKVFHPSIFLSVTAAQGYSELSRFHQCTPEKKSDLLAHNCRLIWVFTVRKCPVIRDTKYFQFCFVSLTYKGSKKWNKLIFSIFKHLDVVKISISKPVGPFVNML